MASRRTVDDPAADLKKGMLDHFNRGLRKDASTDIIVLCGGRTFHVHRNILTWQCKFFRNAFNPALGFKEAVSGEIEMNGDYYDNIFALLEYLYTYDYKVISYGEERGPVAELRFHVRIYATADRYDVPKLKSVALAKFNHTLEHSRIHDVKDTFYKVLRDVYATTPDTDRGLRDIVLHFCASHSEMVLGKRKFVKTMDKIPGLWKEVCWNMLEVVNEDPKLYKCSNCGLADECCSACEPFCKNCGRVFSSNDIVTDSEGDSDSSFEGTIKADHYSSQTESADQQSARLRDATGRTQDMAPPPTSTLAHEISQRRHSVGIPTFREPRSQSSSEGALRKRKRAENTSDDGYLRWSSSPTNKRRW